MPTVMEQRTIVEQLRSRYRSTPAHSIRRTQAAISANAPVRGGVWISQDEFRRPVEDDLREAVYDVIDAFKTEKQHIPPRESVNLCDVRFEWIGQRNAAPKEPQPQLPDSEIFQRLSQEVEHPMTILYAHGGAFYLGSPTFCRPSTTKLAKFTKARVVSIAYRLAPQHTFPAPLLDLLTAWLSLLYPGPDARHPPLSPSSIVLAGDSAGGNLCLAFVQTILKLRTLRPNSTIAFNGRQVEIPLPAGVALLSPWIDLSLSLPSWRANGHIDFLPVIQQGLSPEQPSDEVWPTRPPRGDFYCHPSAWPHLLVSPTVADDWRGAPPLWIAIGEERCADGAKVVAAQAARQGVPVRLSEYLGLPHIFPAMLNALPQSMSCYRDWAEFCLTCFGKGASGIETQAQLIHLPGDRVEDVDVRGLSKLPHEEVVRLAEAAVLGRKAWTGQGSKL